MAGPPPQAGPTPAKKIRCEPPWCALDPSARGLLRFELVPPGPGGFPACYDDAPFCNHVTLVPGDENLFVGGGAMNGAVGKLLLEKAGHPIAFEREGGEYIMAPDPSTGRPAAKFDMERCPYRDMHHELFQRARACVGSSVIADRGLISKTGVPADLAAARVYSSSAHPFGVALLTLFAEERRPLSARNVGMLYTVGALGRNKRAEGEAAPDEEREKLVKTDARQFVAELFMTGANVMQLAADVNAMLRNNGREPIGAVRVPTVSGGTFIHPEVKVEEVGLALLWGIHSSLATVAPELRPRVELMGMEAAYALYWRGAQPTDWNTAEGKDLFALIPRLESSLSFHSQFAQPCWK
eukprot:NODE_8788_length_1469_cov_10.631148.p1 GENE.NODE_8788_length_1469_cov_10.631148~~NODE_8788_length_1469_cov_10.631148.p1  ORF type:complete len:395 (-),score=95.49 NODE_8788_length_1469_cov_10.631148:283-1344(-)